MGDERQLVEAALGGDPVAFAKLAAPARARVLVVASRMVGADEAEDVVQEALLRAFLGLSRLRDRTRFEAWLCGVAVNVARMRLRSAAAQARAVAAAASTTHVVVPEEQELLGVVRHALQLLPAGQRDVVLMHYIDDLSCEEIAQLLRTSSGAVRTRLHRARRQLRRELAPLAPVPFAAEKKECPMIEVKVADVIVRLASGGRPDVVEQTAIVVLQEQHGERSIPIFVDLSAGAALVMRLTNESFPRPVTSDLMVELLRAAGAHIEHVAITTLRENTFYAVVTINNETVDARPSDAINLAVRLGVPILLAKRLLDECGVAGPSLIEMLDREAERFGFKLPPGEWKSLSTELLRALTSTRTRLPAK
jgi:uncharacterized protein